MRALSAVVMTLFLGAVASANDAAPNAKRMYNTVTGFDQLIRDLFLARAVVAVGVQGKTIEGKMVNLAGGVLTLDQAHDKGDYVYIPVSSILFINQK